MYNLGRRSLSRLKGVHPLLSATICLGIKKSTVDFTIIEGVRSKDRQKELFAQGRTKPGKIVTWTLNSNHIPKSDGFGHAVDIAPWVDGAIDWNTWEYFERIRDAIVSASFDIGCEIEWGGDWKRKDGPHFELK